LTLLFTARNDFEFIDTDEGREITPRLMNTFIGTVSRSSMVTNEICGGIADKTRIVVLCI
jgi:hypothetical protein